MGIKKDKLGRMSRVVGVKGKSTGAYTKVREETFAPRQRTNRPLYELFYDLKLGIIVQIEAFLAARKILVYKVVHEFFETA